MADVENLVTLHPSQQGTPGRPAGDTGPLLRSAVVLLHTAWENYVEQLAIEGLDLLLNEIAGDHNRLPASMKTNLGNLKNPWSLAGSLWQAEARAAVEREAGRLNTPNVANTESLFELAIGLPNGLHDISWQKMSRAKVLANVDEFVHDIRGEIVHKGTTPSPLHKGGVENWIKFFDGLVSKLDPKIGTHLEAITGTAPW